MIRWGDYLQKLKEDGVTLESCEEEGLTDSGERIVSQFLQRVVRGRYLYCPVEFTSLTDPVPRRKQRQIANQLRLSVEKYVFREE